MMNAKKSSRMNLSRYLLVAPVVIVLLLAFSLSKAEVAKNTFHAIGTNFLPILNHLKLSNAALPANDKKIAEATNGKLKIVDTLYAAKSKDGKNDILVTSQYKLDSVGYVINGAKATREELLALDPANISSVNLMPAVIAAKYIDFKLDKSAYLFATTRDSEAGKALNARIESGQNLPPLAPLGKDAKTYVTVTDVAPKIVANGKATTIKLKVKANKNSADTGRNLVYTVTTDPVVVSDDATGVVASDVTVKSDAQVIKKVRVNVAPKVGVKVKTADSIRIIADNIKLSLDSNHLAKITSDKAVNVVYITQTDDKNSDDAQGVKHNDKTTIENINSDLLYIVDGKETKSLKNLSAEDIYSITVLKDEAATKKYGKKGKNGVLIITTKKGKK